ncbi:hypothetical protein ANTPLA_LOCUS6509 [Anthophora plagiata]
MATSFKNFRIGVLNTRRLIFKALHSKQLDTMSELLNKVPDVDIDDCGRFKYILINVYDEANSVSKSIVRGYVRSQWHGE